MRFVAVMALAQVAEKGNQNATTAVRDRLKHEDEGVRHAAVMALAEVTQRRVTRMPSLQCAFVSSMRSQVHCCGGGQSAVKLRDKGIVAAAVDDKEVAVTATRICL